MNKNLPPVKLGSTSPKGPACAVHLLQNLEELKTRQRIESIRPFLIAEKCFTSHQIPETSPITIEELKRLAKAWKLNERRNLFRNLNDLNEITTALLQHIEDNKQFTDSTPTSPQNQPLLSPSPPPIEFRPSRNNGKLKNYCGLDSYTRDISPSELVLTTRVYEFPKDGFHFDETIKNWRTEDFGLKDREAKKESERKQSQLKNRTFVKSHRGTHNKHTMLLQLNKHTTGDSTGGGGGGGGASPSQIRRSFFTVAMQENVKKRKHRNLAVHLINYSCGAHMAESLNLKTVQTFVSVSETDDPLIASFCMTALSNLSSCAQGRMLLLELNAFHRITSLLAHTQGKSPATRAAALLIYYFSGEAIEERIFGSAVSAINTYFGRPDSDEIRILCFYILNNLLPSATERNSIVDAILTSALSLQPMKVPSTPDLTLTVLQLLRSMTAFSNVHQALCCPEVLGMLHTITLHSVQEKNIEFCQLVGYILVTLLNSHELPSFREHINLYVQTLMLLFSFSQERRNYELLSQVVRTLAFLSPLDCCPEAVNDSPVVRAVIRLIDSDFVITKEIAVDLSKFLANLTQSNSTKPFLLKLFADQVPLGLFELIKRFSKDHSLRSTLFRALQNLLTIPLICKKLVEHSFPPILRMLDDGTDDPAAISCLFNLSCVEDCDSEFLTQKIHQRIMHYCFKSQSFAAKASYLSVLTQFASRQEFAIGLLELGLIQKLKRMIQLPGSDPIWFGTSKVLLTLVSNRSILTHLSEEDIQEITSILKSICRKESSEDILTQCAITLAIMSFSMNDFKEIDVVMRVILELSHTEMIMVSASTILYNITCCEESVSMLLQDNLYLNMMINMLRTGKREVQENISLALRTLCSHARCVDLLLRTDALADVIVIALLRISNVEIKDNFCEAFYNMLCHEKSRLLLLSGSSGSGSGRKNLFWAINRMSRTDSERVRSMCGRVLFDLSCEDATTLTLREHHVLTFINDIVSTGDPSVLSLGIKAVNIILHKLRSSPLEPHELTAVARIGVGILQKSLSFEDVSNAIVLLVFCAQQPELTPSGVDAEFAILDVVRELHLSSGIWSPDPTCRLYVAHLLWELSKCKNFSKAVGLAELSPVLSRLYENHSSEEVCKLLLSTILRYHTRTAFSAERICELPVWKYLLADAFGVSRLSLSAPTQHRAQSPLPSPSPPYDIHIRVVLISILAVALQSSPSPSSPDRPLLPKPLAIAIISPETIAHPHSRLNLLSLVLQFSMSEESADNLLDANIFELLYSLVSSPSSTASSAITTASSTPFISSPSEHGQHHKQVSRTFEFCGVLLMNLSLHKSLIHKMISHRGNKLDLLVQELIASSNSEVVYMDIALLFHHAVSYQLKRDYSLHPSFVLSMLGKLTEKSQNADLQLILKHLIGVILDKYSGGIQVDPSFVQSIFLELQTNSIANVSSSLSSVKAKNFPLTASISEDPFQGPHCIPTLPLRLRTSPPSENQWSPYLSFDKMEMTKEEISQSCRSLDPEFYRLSQSCDLFPWPLFTKFTHKYEMISLRNPSAGSVVGGSGPATGGNSFSVSAIAELDPDQEEGEEEDTLESIYLQDYTDMLHEEQLRASQGGEGMGPLEGEREKGFEDFFPFGEGEEEDMERRVGGTESGQSSEAHSRGQSEPNQIANPSRGTLGSAGNEIPYKPDVELTDGHPLDSVSGSESTVEAHNDFSLTNVLFPI